MKSWQYLKISISMTDALTTYIQEKDKESIWDGNIHVYSNAKKDPEHHIGRVLVQVKGKVTDNINQDIFTYPIRTKDLKSYLAEGGIIYFVVLIDQVMSDTKIFYANLLPFEIVKLLERAQNQDTKNVTMRSFPEINCDKVDIFFNFIRDRKDQQPTASLEKICSLEEIVKQGAFKELNFGNSVVMKLDNLSGESKFNVSFTDGLKERIAGLEFYIDAIEAQHYYIGQAKIPLITDDSKEIEKLKLSDKKEHLALLKKIQQALDIVGVRDDLSCDILTDRDENNLRFLTKDFVDKKEVTFETDAEVFLAGYLTTTNIRMMITTHKQKSGTYILGNFFMVDFQ